MTNQLSGDALLDALEAGSVRVAERDSSGDWRVQAWVKQGILDLFRSSPNVSKGEAEPLGAFVDKAAFGVRRFQAQDGVRLVPGGSAVRRGVHVAAGTILMPPCYVNVGAYIGTDSMVDSHALVGSCAQIGQRVHVSAGAQIGGVLEPVGSQPVIIEDDVLVGGQAGLFEGVLIRARAVIAAGTILTGSTRVFDLVQERELRAPEGAPLEIPAGAVVVPGTRPASGDFASRAGLGVACALIVKIRDEQTSAATALEQALRSVSH